MSKDQRLEQLLLNMGQEKIHRPKDLVAKTITRLHNTPSSVNKGGYKLNKITRNIGITVAACALLVVGFMTTWSALSWLSGPGVTGDNIDLTQDPRVIQAQQYVDFELGLPTWIPEGFSLKDVRFPSPISAYKDYTFTMVFEGPEGTEPLTITQSHRIDVFFPANTSFVDFTSKDGLDGFMLRGYFFESQRFDSTLTGRTTVFAHNQTFIIITSEISPLLSRNPTEILSSTELLRIASSIVGSDTAQLVAPDDQFHLARNWTVAVPEYSPSEFQYIGMQLKLARKWATTGNEETLVATHTATLEYSAGPNESYRISYSDPEFPLVMGNYPNETDIDGVTGYFYTRDNTLVLGFQTKSATIEIIGTETPGFTRTEYRAIAKSMVEPKSPQTATLNRQQVAELLVLPTTFNISYSPDGKMFIGYLPANYNIAVLWDLKGNMFGLPGAENLSDYGPVSWRGNKLVYHAASRVLDDSNSTGKIVVYDTSNHTHIEIVADNNWGPNLLKPVLLDNDTVAIAANNGAWVYSISQKTWSKLMEFNVVNEYRKLAWSPDGKWVAWVDKDVDDDSGPDQLVVLDLQANPKDKMVFAGHTSIPGIAWSPDSNYLAVAAINSTGNQELLIINPSNADKSAFPISSYNGKLTWIPGTNRVAYMRGLPQAGLAVVNIDDGRTIVDSEIMGNHAWLPDGRLAHIPGTSVLTSDGEEMYQVFIYEINWR